MDMEAEVHAYQEGTGKCNFLRSKELRSSETGNGRAANQQEEAFRPHSAFGLYRQGFTKSYLVIDCIGQTVNFSTQCCGIQIHTGAAWEMHFVQHLHQMTALIADYTPGLSVHQEGSCGIALYIRAQLHHTLPWTSHSIWHKILGRSIAFADWCAARQQPLGTEGKHSPHKRCDQTLAMMALPREWKNVSQEQHVQADVGMPKTV